MSNEHVLDNAAWHALRGTHAPFAEGGERALRYHPDVSVFHAVPDNDPASWSAVADLATDGVVVLFRGTPIEPPAGWTRVFGGEGYQMVLAADAEAAPSLPNVDPATGAAVAMRPLATDDVEPMLALIKTTKPGPFRPRTIELGGYVGIFHDDTLVAMAGRRTRPPGYCEISAVCTHPDARRRGYASVVTMAVAAGIRAEGDTPLLHVADNNDSARAVYEQLGFETRTMVLFAGYTRDS